jgi:hypothetical protein
MARGSPVDEFELLSAAVAGPIEKFPRWTFATEQAWAALSSVILRSPKDSATALPQRHAAA